MMLRSKDLKVIFSLPFHENHINDLQVFENSSSEYLVSCSDDKDISFLDLAQLKKWKSL